MAALPWLAAWLPHWAPMLVVAALFAWPLASRARSIEPWASGLGCASATLFLIYFGGWAVAGGWLGLACLVVPVLRLVRRPGWGRPDAADAAAMVGWGVAIGVHPGLIGLDMGGWLAPLVLLVAGRRLAVTLVGSPRSAACEPLPPAREVRGTLSLRGAVVAGPDNTPRTVPVDLEVRAGRSVAVLSDDAQERELLADLLAGRRPPLDGVVAVDGMPLAGDDALVAVVGTGERFIAGGIEANLGALCAEPPSRGTVTALVEACGLDEVAEALGDGMIDASGAPLEPLHRLLLATARVIPSHYRVLVVVDPMPWVNSVRAERWRSAVVRASVGRTAVWITADRDLASRADQLLEFRQGSLRPIEP